MKFEHFPVPGPVLVAGKRIGDSRGWFSETFREEEFAGQTGSARFVQHNQSFSQAQGTVRGLHFQLAPMGQGKLVRCLKGAILDVAVDIRRSSPTFGQHVAAQLSEQNGNQLWVPEGFAHGFLTLMPDTEVFYMVTNYYSPAHERGLLWNDPSLNIDWGLEAASAHLSDKDKTSPRLSELAEAFA